MPSHNRNRSRPGNRASAAGPSHRPGTRRQGDDDDDNRDRDRDRRSRRGHQHDGDDEYDDQDSSSDDQSDYDDDRETLDNRKEERPRYPPRRPSEPVQSRDPVTLTSYEIREHDSSRTHRVFNESGRRENERLNPSLTGVFGARPPPASVPAPVPAPVVAPPTTITNPGQVSMTKIFFNFLDYPLESFRECADYMRDNKRVLDENTNALQLTARALFGRADTKRGERCVERILMIKMCNDYGVEYLDDLKKRANRLTKFRLDFEKMKTALKASAGTVTNDTPAVPPGPNNGPSPPPPPTAMKMQMGDQGSLIDDTASLKIGASIPKDRRQSFAGEGMRTSYPAKPNRTQSQSTAYSYTPGAPLFETREPDTTPIGRTSGDTLAKLGADSLPPLADFSRSRRDRSSVANKSSLDKKYYVRRDAKSFFVAGRIFKVLWHSPSGANIHGQVNQAKQMTGAYGEPIYSQLRWMMVIKQKDGYSLCCPISTYGGTGLVKKTLSESEVRAHAIVYNSGSKPRMLQGEPRLPKEAIEVNLEPGVPNIEAASRVHFGKCYTVEWNVKVMNVGMVDRSQSDRITAYFISELRM